MSLFFINQVRSEELKKRLKELYAFKPSSSSPREALMIDVIICLCAEVDRISNPDRIDEYFTSLSKEVRIN